MLSPVTAHPHSPLERARSRLRRAMGTADACEDDLACPGWASFRNSRATFLTQAGSPGVDRGPDRTPPRCRDGR